jgi:hypothetical protein
MYVYLHECPGKLHRYFQVPEFQMPDLSGDYKAALADFNIPLKWTLLRFWYLKIGQSYMSRWEILKKQSSVSKWPRQ